MPNTTGSGGGGEGRSDRGFAAMDDEKQSEIARKGGEAIDGVEDRGPQRHFDATTVHDHTTWGVFGVLQGVEHEEVFDADLNLIGHNEGHVGDVNGVTFTPDAPPEVRTKAMKGNETTTPILRADGGKVTSG